MNFAAHLRCGQQFYFFILIIGIAMKLNRKRNRRSRNHSYESLEPRRMLAGNVRVAVNDGAFFVRGDTEANQIHIERGLDGQGSVRVTGLEGTTVNGQDEVLIQVEVSKGFRINMGAGDDFVRLEDVNAGGITRVYGGAGNDQVSVYQATLNDAFIQTFTGDDSVSLDSVIVNGDLRIVTLHGDDTVGISGLRSFGRNFVATGTGNDSFVMKDSAIYREDLRVFTFDGDDFVGTDNISVAGESWLATGKGNDGVSIFSTQFLKDTVVAGNVGQDEVSVSGKLLSEDTLSTFGFEGELEFPNGKTNQVFLSQVRSGVRLGTITELAIVTPQLSTLVGALKATGLDAALDDENATLTAFAPLNSAFDNLPEGLLDSLTTEQLADILKFHVTPGEVFAEDLVQLDSVMTLLGESFTVEVGEEVVLNGNAKLAVTDIRAKNGVVHVLRDVLVPV